MVKKLNDIKPMPDDGDDEQPDLDLTKPLGVQANARTFGKVDLPDDGREVIKPIALDLISRDPAQPRKAIPKTVSRVARQEGIPEWLAWHRMAEHEAGHPIDLKRLLRGEGDPLEDEKPPELVRGFLALVGLAATIRRDKLTNPISIVRLPGVVDRYEIETGERRWHAHQMLNGALKLESFGKIKARIVPKASIWAQATENSEREELTAIGKARQLALLLIEEYRGRDGVSFQSYREMIGEDDLSDRAYYAQVANGNVYKVPDGQGADFLKAVGLSSKSQLAHYRKLLKLPDELWVKFDEENWKEFAIREEMTRLKNPEWFTAVNHSQNQATQVSGGFTQKEGHLVAPNAPISYPLHGPGQRFMMYYGKRVQLERGTPTAMRVWFIDDTTGERGLSRLVALADLRDPEAPAPATPARPFGAPRQAPVTAPALAINGIYLGPQKKHYRVLVVTGSLARCEEVSPVNGRRLAGPFSLNVSDLQPLPTAAADTYDADEARRAIMDDDDETDQPDISATEALAQMGRSAALAEEPTHAPLPRLTEREEELLLALFVGSSFVRDDMVRRTLLTHKLVKPVGDAPWQLEITGRGIDCLIDCGRAKRSHETADYAPIPPQDAFKPWREGQHVLVDHFAYRFEGHIRQVFASVGRVEVHLAGTKDHRQTVDTKYLRNLDPNWPAATEDTWEDDDTAPLTPMTAIDLRPLPFPEWAATGRLVRDIDRALTGMAQDARWDGRVWQVSVRFQDHTGEVPLDMLQPDDPTPILPAWAFTGGWVVHRDSGQTCEITAVVLNTQTVDWELKVLVLPAEGPAQAPLSDFTFSDETRPRHPALEASNRGGVVTTDQHLMGPLVEMARKLKMKEAESFAISTQTTTADGLAKRLRTGGELTTRAHLDAQREAALAIVAEITAAINRIYTADHQAVTDLVKELEAQHGAAR